MNLSVTLAIVIITVSTSLLAWQKQDMFDKFKLNPWSVIHRKEYWRLLTHTLLHADWMHLIFNMISLYSIGSVVESSLGFYKPGHGQLYFALLYIGGAIFSSVGDLVRKKDQFQYNSIGASGAVSAVIFAFVLLSPGAWITVFVFPMPAVLFGIIFLGAEYYMSKRGSAMNINHGAHFEGALFGIAFMLLLEPALALQFVQAIKDLLS